MNRRELGRESGPLLYYLANKHMRACHVKPALSRQRVIDLFSITFLKHRTINAGSHRRRTMPEQRGISISLQSQYDALSLPEFPAPVPAASASGGLLSHKTNHEPDQPDIAEAYTPIYPGSQFWIVFCCREPAAETRYYYFKLFLGGKCVLSWGCGEKNGWSGRVGFGIFESSGDDLAGYPLLEKRAFVFPNMRETNEGGSFEIRVYRATARKRQDRPIKAWKQGVASEGVKMNIVSALCNKMMIL